MMNKLNVMKRLRAWLKDVPISDPVERRMATLLQVILLGLMIIIVASSVMNLFLAINITMSAIAVRTLVAVLIIGMLFMLLRRGYFRSSTVFIIALLFLVETYAVSISALRSIAETLSFYTLAIILAGLLLGRGALAVTLGLSAAVLSLKIQFTSAELRSDEIVIAGNFILLNGLVGLFIDRFGVTLRTALGSALARELDLKNEAREREQAEAALRQSEDMYRRAIMAAGAVPYYLDHRTRTYTFMGEGILPMTGYTAEEMNPDLWVSLEQEGFPRGNLAHLSYEEADRLTEENNDITWECDYRIRTRNGETRWVADTSVKGLNEKGKRVGVIGILQDITERKLAEQALKIYADRLKILHDIDRAILAAQSPEQTARAALVHIRRLIACNRASVTIFDHEERRSRLLAINTDRHTQLLSGDGISFDDYGVEAITGLQSGRPYLIADFQVEASPPKSNKRLLAKGLRAWLACPLQYQGKLFGALNLSSNEPNAFAQEHIDIAVDIANQLAIAIQQNRLLMDVQQLNAELEARVAQRTNQLEAAMRELDSFSYSVSHDLRAPLRAVSSYSQIIRAQYGHQLPPEGREDLEKVIAGAQQMHGLIEAMLALSRMTRGELHKRDLDLSALAREVLQTLQQNDPGRPVACVVAEGLSAHADEKLMRNVLQNLLGNAWKYTARAEAPRIEFGMAEQNGGKTFFIRDNGIGFDMKYKDKLFGAFQRLHTEDEFQGHGIGLASAQRIIQKHGGRIWAESEPGKGATFYFTFG